MGLLPTTIKNITIVDCFFKNINENMTNICIKPYYFKNYNSLNNFCNSNEHKLFNTINKIICNSSNTLQSTYFNNNDDTHSNFGIIIDKQFIINSTKNIKKLNIVLSKFKNCLKITFINDNSDKDNL